MRRAKEESSPLFLSKKLDTGVTKGNNVEINKSKGIRFTQSNKNSGYGEDVETSSLNPRTNISRDTETELNSKVLECQSNCQQQSSLDDFKELVPLNSNESGCEKEESVTTNEVTKQIPRENLSKKPYYKWENGKKKAKLAELTFHRRKLTNLKLSQIIFPKCASMVLNDLKRGCAFTTVEKSMSPRLVLVTVKHEDGLTAFGEGSSKAEAKNIAAENAIKKIVLDLILQNERLCHKDIDFEDTGRGDMIFMNLPWKELTSLAVYKLFEEWQNQGVRFPELFLSKLKVPPTPNEDLPFVTNDRNPCAILSTILPGLAAVEIERQDFPRFHVTMGYLVEGKLYSATGGTKKEAKKKAAVMVLKALFGMEIPE